MISLNNNKKKRSKTQENILAAAIINFAEKGYAKTTLMDIANTADITKGGIYHHFPSKENLFIAICEKNRQMSIERMSGLFQKKQNLLTDLEKFYDMDIDDKNAQKIWFEMIAESTRNSKIHAIMSKQRQEFDTIIMQSIIQLKKNTGLLKNHKESDLITIVWTLSLLYDGLVIENIGGKDPKMIKKIWIKTVYSILSSDIVNDNPSAKKSIKN